VCKIGSGLILERAAQSPSGLRLHTASNSDVNLSLVGPSRQAYKRYWVHFTPANSIEMPRVCILDTIGQYYLRSHVQIEEGQRGALHKKNNLFRLDADKR
jgi:hypothetical protein